MRPELHLSKFRRIEGEYQVFKNDALVFITLAIIPIITTNSLLFGILLLLIIGGGWALIRSYYEEERNERGGRKSK